MSLYSLSTMLKDFCPLYYERTRCLRYKSKAFKEKKEKDINTVHKKESKKKKKSSAQLLLFNCSRVFLCRYYFLLCLRSVKSSRRVALGLVYLSQVVPNCKGLSASYWMIMLFASLCRRRPFKQAGWFQSFSSRRGICCFGYGFKLIW